jgi:hypothetical protein
MGLNGMERQARTISQGRRGAAERMKSKATRKTKRRNKMAKNTPKVRLSNNEKTPRRPIRKKRV